MYGYPSFLRLSPSWMIGIGKIVCLTFVDRLPLPPPILFPAHSLVPDGHQTLCHPWLHSNLPFPKLTPLRWAAFCFNYCSCPHIYPSDRFNPYLLCMLTCASSLTPRVCMPSSVFSIQPLQVYELWPKLQVIRTPDLVLTIILDPTPLFPLSQFSVVWSQKSSSPRSAGREDFPLWFLVPVQQGYLLALDLPTEIYRGSKDPESVQIQLILPITRLPLSLCFQWILMSQTWTPHLSGEESFPVASIPGCMLDEDEWVRQEKSSLRGLFPIECSSSGPCGGPTQRLFFTWGFSVKGDLRSNGCPPDSICDGKPSLPMTHQEFVSKK